MWFYGSESLCWHFQITLSIILLLFYFDRLSDVHGFCAKNELLFLFIYCMLLCFLYEVWYSRVFLVLHQDISVLEAWSHYLDLCMSWTSIYKFLAALYFCNTNLLFCYYCFFMNCKMFSFLNSLLGRGSVLLTDKINQRYLDVDLKKTPALVLAHILDGRLKN